MNDPKKKLKERQLPVRLEKMVFEAYVRKEKPYLNPDLRIADMTAPLMTNRSYLSAFVNQEYGVNFSRYINRLRFDELASIRSNPKFHGLTEAVLVQKAGFSSYFGYRRFVRTEKIGPCLQKHSKLL